MIGLMVCVSGLLSHRQQVCRWSCSRTGIDFWYWDAWSDCDVYTFSVSDDLEPAQERLSALVAWAERWACRVEVL